MAGLCLRSIVVVVLSIAVPVELATAQLPPHKPGTICVTPTFWCYASPPGKPGSPCQCPTPKGPVRGTLQ